MKIAIPVVDNQLCLHFGHCQQFAFFDVDPDSKTITNITMLTPPPHEPGVLPRWIREQNASLVITGGMGSRARSLFQQAGVQVVTGAPPLDLREVVTGYLNNTLPLGQNACDH